MKKIVNLAIFLSAISYFSVAQSGTMSEAAVSPPSSFYLSAGLGAVFSNTHTSSTEDSSAILFPSSHCLICFNLLGGILGICSYPMKGI